MKVYLCTGTNKNKNLYVPLIYSGSLFNLYLIFVCNVYIVHVMYMMYYYVYMYM